VKITAAGEFLLKKRAAFFRRSMTQPKCEAHCFRSGRHFEDRFVESISCMGSFRDSLTDFRKNQPDVELHLKALSSLEQMAAIQSGSLDAG